MKIIFFAHPHFLGHQSMPRYASMLAEGMKKRGHNVQLWMPRPIFYRIPFPEKIKKWMSYIDQYIFFPIYIRSRLRKEAQDTLFVFTDHALGPWVNLVANRPHVIHCHDFLAQLSALGEIQENKTSWTGRQYQNFIRQGYRKGKYFISVSQKTKKDLHRFLLFSPKISEVVYNGLNYKYTPDDPVAARNLLGQRIGINLSSGFLLHVGGNEWYKNKAGVIEIYNAWCSNEGQQIPLLLVGNMPDSKIANEYEKSPFKSEIHFLKGLNNEDLSYAYIGASLLLFPSLDEGFGWPIAEAMASGCPVITTDHAPMTEVGGNAALYISRRPNNASYVSAWANEGAKAINKVLSISPNQLKYVMEVGLLNTKRFATDLFLDKIESIYKMVLSQENTKVN